MPEGWGWKQRRRADTKPFHYSRACCAHAPLHAGRRRHAAATCDLSCGQRRQRARATAPAVARGRLAWGCERWRQQPPVTYSAGSGANVLELRRPPWQEVGWRGL